MVEKVTKMRSEEPLTASKYLDLRFILATSNICECLFSKAGYRLTDSGREFNRQNFESQMYFLIDSEYWGIGDIHSLTK